MICQWECDPWDHHPTVQLLLSSWWEPGKGMRGIVPELSRENYDGGVLGYIYIYNIILYIYILYNIHIYTYILYTIYIYIYMSYMYDIIYNRSSHNRWEKQRNGGSKWYSNQLNMVTVWVLRWHLITEKEQVHLASLGWTMTINHYQPAQIQIDCFFWAAKSIGLVFLGEEFSVVFLLWRGDFATSHPDYDAMSHEAAKGIAAQVLIVKY